MFHVSTMLPYMPNNPQQVRKAQLRISTSCIAQTWPNLSWNIPPLLSQLIVQMLFIFFAHICQCFVASSACGRPSFQRNIWNGSEVYGGAAVNPVDALKLFFFIQHKWPQLLDSHTRSLYFSLCVVMKELFWLFLFQLVIVKFSCFFYLHWVWLSGDFHADCNSITWHLLPSGKCHARRYTSTASHGKSSLKTVLKLSWYLYSGLFLSSKNHKTKCFAN